MRDKTWYASDLALFYWHEMIDNYSLSPMETVNAAVLYYLYKDLSAKLYQRKGYQKYENGD